MPGHSVDVFQFYYPRTSIARESLLVYVCVSSAMKSNRLCTQAHVLLTYSFPAFLASTKQLHPTARKQSFLDRAYRLTRSLVEHVKFLLKSEQFLTTPPRLSPTLRRR
jgi:hypothetical protein